MAVAKCTTGNDVVYGMAACATGATPIVRETGTVGSGGQGVGNRWANVDSLTFFETLDTRYRNKPGPNGSGNWELYE